MNYVSLTFALFFLCLLAAYVLTPNRHKWITLLVFSLVFYAFSGWDKLLILLGTSLAVYAAARWMERIWQDFDRQCLERKPGAEEKRELKEACKRRSRHVLWLALALCLGILVWCKLAGRVLDTVNRLSGSYTVWKIIVPLGLSYYTFSAVGYLLDVHWRKARAEHSYPRLLLCMCYFPHIVEGPISRYNRLLPQFETLTNPDYERLCMGLQLTLWGLFKKLVIADRLAIFVNDVFGNIMKNEGMTFVVALFFSAFWFYTDFSGCMDMVTGISDILGVKLDRNFHHPFFSRSAPEFWRRWHITLGTWFKDYVYVPVTTSSLTRKLRRGASKRFGPKGANAVMTVFPLSVVWLLTGLWHGTGSGYVIWGMYWGALIIASNLLEERVAAWSDRLHIRRDSRPWAWFQMLRTFLLYMIGCVLILPDRFRSTLLVIQRIFSVYNPWIFWDKSLYAHGLDQRNMFVAILSILLLLVVDAMQERMNVREAVARRNIVLRWAIYLAGIFAVIILGIYGPGYDAAAFTYEQF